MRTILISAVLALTMALGMHGQTSTEETVPRPGRVETTRANIPTNTSAAATTSSSQNQQNGYVRPDPKTRFKRYIKSMFGPVALGTRAVRSGYSTWRNSPEEWGPGWEGFGRRFASSTGRSIIKNSTMYGLDEVLKVDSKFYRSRKKDFGSRLTNALISPVTARKPNGKRVFGFPRVVGTYTSGIVAAETWYPNRYNYKNGLKSGTISLGFNAAVNVFKEFVWKK